MTPLIIVDGGGELHNMHLACADSPILPLPTCNFEGRDNSCSQNLYPTIADSNRVYLRHSVGSKVVDIIASNALCNVTLITCLAMTH